MRIILHVVILAVLTSAAAWAQGYSCRTADGRLHFSDSLQGLPQECWGREEKLKSEQPDNLNYVPAAPAPGSSGIEFRHSVRDAERELQRQPQSEVLQRRANKLYERYRDAKAEKRQALRSWSYQSRKIIKQADLEIAGLLEEKQQLLDELEKGQVKADEDEKIRSVLNRITAE